jgi:hypothetical protein
MRAPNERARAAPGTAFVSYPTIVDGTWCIAQSQARRNSDFCEFCDGRHRHRLNKLLSMQGDLESRGPSMLSKDIIVAVAITFAVTFAILTAKIAESGNEKASNPTITTLPLQY